MGDVYVVTGAARGIGRALTERLLRDSHAVVAVDVDAAALQWVREHPSADRAVAVTGSADDPAVTERAADLAQSAGTLKGWVNNAAVFRDASLHDTPVSAVLGLIAGSLDPAVAGCAAALRRFLADGTPGSIVNVTSHQATRAVPGCTPYVTAKAAVEGLTRALAVEYGPYGTGVNAVAPGCVATDAEPSNSPPPARPWQRASTTRRTRSTRWAGWDGPRRRLLPSRTCSPPTPGSSPVRRCRSTGGGPSWGATRTGDRTRPASRPRKSAGGRLPQSVKRSTQRRCQGVSTARGW